MIFTNEKILLLSKGSTFMVDAIANNLKDIGYEVVRCEPSRSVFLKILRVLE